jgi:hypothetical protein
MTTALQCIKFKKPCTLVGFEPGIFCSVVGRARPTFQLCLPARLRHWKMIGSWVFFVCTYIQINSLLFSLFFQPAIKRFVGKLFGSKLSSYLLSKIGLWKSDSQLIFEKFRLQRARSRLISLFCMIWSMIFAVTVFT